MKNIIAIILAAGRGTRMKSETPKILHKILGKTIIGYVLDSVKEAGVSEIIVVAGYGSELLKLEVRGAKVVIQKSLLGSGDAVATAKKVLKNYSGDILVVCGDTPLIRPETIKKLMEKHSSSGASATILTAELKDPSGYGRIARNADGKVSGIVEEINASLYEEVINEINVGTYCFKAGDLFEALSLVKIDGKKREVFLTDTIAVLRGKGKAIESVLAEDPDEAIGVNTRIDLALSTTLLKKRTMYELMLGGVTIEDPASTIIHPGVKIGKDTTIYSNTVIESGVEIGSKCRIGPFSRIRPGVVLDDGVEVGNFVELVRTKIGAGTKVKHHTYLGDSVVGKKVNIGAGTITANYDGKSKNKTIIEDGAFIGVGAVLIAPVHIGAGALVGAGSVVPKNHDVPKLATVVGVPARIYKSRKITDRRKK